MSKYSNVYDNAYFKVHVFFTRFPSNSLLERPPRALFTRDEDAIEWAKQNCDGKNYNVVSCNGVNLFQVK